MKLLSLLALLYGELVLRGGFLALLALVEKKSRFRAGHGAEYTILRHHHPSVETSVFASCQQSSCKAFMSRIWLSRCEVLSMIIISCVPSDFHSLRTTSYSRICSKSTRASCWCTNSFILALHQLFMLLVASLFCIEFEVCL